MTPVRMLRDSSLDELGDLNAPLGSRPWALAVRSRIWGLLKDAESSVVHLRVSVEAMEEHQGFRQLSGPDGELFTTFAAFCVAPSPWGLGYDPAILRRIVLERESAQARAEHAQPLATHGEIGRGRTNRDDVIISMPHQGTSADYLTARIARDRPDILARMKAGEFRSVHEAAREAGFVPPRCSIRTDDPAAAARALARHFDVDALIEALEAVRSN